MDYQEGKEMADRWGMRFVETSAKSSQNVEDLFHGLAEDCLKQQQKNINNGKEQETSTVNLFSNASHTLNTRVTSCCR